MANGGEMAEVKLWDYDLIVNDNQSQLIGSSSSSSKTKGHCLLDHQTLPDYGFSSFLEEFEKEHGFAEYQKTLESQLAPDTSMANDHDSSSEQNPVAREDSTMSYFPTLEEIPLKNSLVHDLVSPLQEPRKMDYIPTFVENDVVMAVHQIASLPEEEFQEFVMNSNMVYDHVDSSNEGNVAMEVTIQTPKIHSSNEGNVAMEETIQTPNIHSSNEGNVTMEETMPNPVTLGENVVPHKQEGWLDTIPCPTVTFPNRVKPQVCWTPALHERFVRAVKHLGGCRCRCKTEGYFTTDECRGLKSNPCGEPPTEVPQGSISKIGGQFRLSVECHVVLNEALWCWLHLMFK